PALIEFDAFRINAFVRPDWLDVQPRHAVIPPGSFQEFAVAFDSAGSGSAVYQGAIFIESNGLPSSLRVPATLNVIAAPHIVVAQEVITPESVRSFSSTGEVTQHDFAVTAPPVGTGKVELTANGDFGLPSETADILLE